MSRLNCTVWNLACTLAYLTSLRVCKRELRVSSQPCSRQGVTKCFTNFFLDSDCARFTTRLEIPRTSLSCRRLSDVQSWVRMRLVVLSVWYASVTTNQKKSSYWKTFLITSKTRSLTKSPLSLTHSILCYIETCPKVMYSSRRL